MRITYPASGAGVAGGARRGRRLILALLVTLVVGALPGALRAANAFDEATATLLVEAVTAAFEVDLYNDRCRSDRSGRHIDNLNKQLASKLRVTVIGVLDDLFPEGSYPRAQARLQADFLERLRTLGGCDGAKAAGLPLALRERYDAATAAVAALP